MNHTEGGNQRTRWIFLLLPLGGLCVEGGGWMLLYLLCACGLFFVVVVAFLLAARSLWEHRASAGHEKKLSCVGSGGRQWSIVAHPTTAKTKWLIRNSHTYSTAVVSPFFFPALFFFLCVCVYFQGLQRGAALNWFRCIFMSGLSLIFVQMGSEHPLSCPWKVENRLLRFHYFGKK